jgi:CheY-like chemotaxis protein
MPETETINAPYILIVDDNLINRKYFSMSLLKSGFKVETAENGQQAIDLAKSFLFDLILMDIRMPDLNGFEVSQIIKQETGNTNTPILATSAENLSSDEALMFTDFLLKPISPSELSRKINLYCKTAFDNVFDQKQALAFAYNDSDIMQKLLKMFNFELPQQFKLLLDSINNMNYKESVYVIHKLRGSSKTCGAVEIDRILNQLNQALTSENFSNIKKIMSELNVAIEKYLKLVNKIIC